MLYAAAGMNGRYQARLVSTALAARWAAPSAVGRVHSVFRAAVGFSAGLRAAVGGSR